MNQPAGVVAASRTACGAESRPVPEASASRGLRVLVVDDSDDAASTLALLLRMSGHQTTTAADGVEALQAASTFEPDAVLLDIGLPGLNGHEVAERLRAGPDGERLLLVAVTGRSQELDADDSRDAGFDAHLVKPLDLDRLLDLLAAWQPDARARPVGAAATG